MAAVPILANGIIRFPRATDAVVVPQGFARVDGKDLVYDTPRSPRDKGLSDQAIAKAVRRLNQCDPAAVHAVVDAYCRPLNDRRSFEDLPGRPDLALMAIDVHDADTVHEFIEQHCRTALHHRRYRYLPEEVVIRELPTVDLTDGGCLVDFLDSYGMINLDADRHEDWCNLESRTPLHGVEQELLVLQLLARHYIASGLGKDVMDVWRDVSFGYQFDRPSTNPERGNTRKSETTWVDAATSEKECHHLFNSLLDDVLRTAHFHPHITRTLRRDGDDDEFLVVDDYPHDLTDALKVQLVALIESQLPVRECANETHHGAAFVRQRGRAKKGRHRTIGTKYCSPECANARAQRESRMRARNQRLKAEFRAD